MDWEDERGVLKGPRRNNEYSIISNAITEIEITRDKKNSRVTQAEERLSELEDTMLEINEAEQGKKINREIRTASESSGTILNDPIFK